MHTSCLARWSGTSSRQNDVLNNSKPAEVWPTLSSVCDGRSGKQGDGHHRPHSWHIAMCRFVTATAAGPCVEIPRVVRHGFSGATDCDAISTNADACRALQWLYAKIVKFTSERHLPDWDFNKSDAAWYKVISCTFSLVHPSSSVVTKLHGKRYERAWTSPLARSDQARRRGTHRFVRSRVVPRIYSNCVGPPCCHYRSL